MFPSRLSAMFPVGDLEHCFLFTHLFFECLGISSATAFPINRGS